MCQLLGMNCNRGEDGAAIVSVGPFSTTTRTLTAIETGLPVDVRVDLPTAPGPWPVVVYQHGFLLDVDWTSTLLTQVASHGIVVVAPQMYAANNVPFGKPTTIEEAADAAIVLAFVDELLADALDVEIRGPPVLAGHSRGGKVLWRVLRDDVTAGRGLVLLDPVDGAQAAADPPAVDGALAFMGPTVVLGLGLSTTGRQACAPAADGHDHFISALPQSAHHVVVADGGHLDLLDDEQPGCIIVCTVCTASSAPQAVRSLGAGVIVATVKAADGNDDAIDDALAHAPMVVENRP